jgi:ureidoglycolate hydrolase
MFGWFRKWRRRKSPVVQVQTHTFSFPATGDSLFVVEAMECDPQQSVAFWSTNVPHHVDVEINKETGMLIATRVGAASEHVEAKVTVVEFAK